MARLMIKCPKTGKPIETGIDMDKSTFESGNVHGDVQECARIAASITVSQARRMGG